MKDGPDVNHRPDDVDHRDPAIEALYGEVADEMPPPGLDRQILAAAHRAVGARPRAADARSPARRWSVPLSIAATLLLSVSLVTTMLRERPEQLSIPEGARPDAQQRGYEPQPPPADDSRSARKAPPAAMAAPDTHERERAAERSAAPARRPVAPAAREQGAGDLAASAARDPARWLEEIDAQFRRHDRDAARRSLEAFRQRYPDHPIPGALLEMEKERK